MGASPVDKFLSKRGGILGKIADNHPLFGEGFKAQKQAKKDQRAQKALIAEQAKLEKRRLAVASSDVASARARGTQGRGGRQSLIATSQTGLAKTLGGTTGG